MLTLQDNILENSLSVFRLDFVFEGLPFKNLIVLDKVKGILGEDRIIKVDDGQTVLRFQVAVHFQEVQFIFEILQELEHRLVESGQVIEAHSVIGLDILLVLQRGNFFTHFDIHLLGKGLIDLLIFLEVLLDLDILVGLEELVEVLQLEDVVALLQALDSVLVHDQALAQ